MQCRLSMQHRIHLDDSESAVYLCRKDNNKPHADLTLPSSVVPTLGPDVKDMLCILVYRKIISATLPKYVNKLKAKCSSKDVVIFSYIKF